MEIEFIFLPYLSKDIQRESQMSHRRQCPG